MRKQIILCTFFILTCLFLCNGVFAADSTSTTSLADNSDVQAELMDSSIPFIENDGQQDSQVEYYANTLYGTAYVTSDGVTHVVGVNENDTAVIQEQFLDADNNQITISSKGENKSDVKVNYYQGNDSSKWYTGVATYNQVSLGEIYPNITVKLKANGGSVEKYFYLEPGADINDIIIQILGANSLEILDDGSLAIHTDNETLIMTAPIAYQDNNNVDVSYQILSNNTYSFNVANYDPNKTLIIDPTLTYSTYLGGTDYDYGYGVAVDADGNIYIIGQTYSTDFPVTPDAYQKTHGGGYYDTFVSVFNNTGNLSYSTYLGGTYYDYGYGVAVDTDGNIYITGYTESTDFPVTTNAYQKTNNGYYDVFLSVFNSTGDLTYSTYLGGTYYDYGRGVAVDEDGNIYITGYTASSNFPVTTDAYQKTARGGYDAFVSIFDNTGNLTYSTYLGGTVNDVSYGVDVDEDGNIYITGYTKSSNFPVTTNAYQNTNHGNQDAFISVFNNTGNLTYSTYLGGTNNEVSYDVAVDTDANIYITGNTYSTDFPVTTNAYQNTNQGSSESLVSALNNTGNITYSAYSCGTDNEISYGVAVDTDANIYITGYTESTNFPVTTNTYQNTNQGSSDSFVSVLDNTGNLTYSTYLGGTDYDFGLGISVDTDGNIYITGFTYSTNFPVTPDAYQNIYPGGYDAFVAKFEKEDTSIVVSDVRGKTGDTVDLTATLTDNSGSPLDGKDITFTVNGTDYIGTTGVDGVATVSYLIGLSSGQYPIKATFNGDSYYKSSENTGTLTVDNEAPLITATSPVNGATRVPSNKTITVTFSEDIIGGTQWIELVNSTGEAIPFAMTISGNVLTITPDNDLVEAAYKLILHTGCVTDLAGNPLAVTNFKFTVGTSPTVTATSPVNGTTNVPASKTITVTFSEAIRKSSNFWVELVNITTGTDVDYTSYITGGNMLVISPVDDLAEASYKVILHTGCVTDLAGNPLAVTNFKFTVGTSPTVTATSPVDGATNVNVAKTITVTFNEAIRKTSNFWVELVNTTTEADVDYTSYITGGNMLVISPVDDLEANTNYNVILHTGCVTDLAGNPLRGTSFSFTTRNT